MAMYKFKNEPEMLLERTKNFKIDALICLFMAIKFKNNPDVWEKTIRVVNGNTSPINYICQRIKDLMRKAGISDDDVD